MPTKTARPAKSRKLAVTKDTLKNLAPTKQKAKGVKGGVYASGGCVCTDKAPGYTRAGTC